MVLFEDYKIQSQFFLNWLKPLKILFLEIVDVKVKCEYYGYFPYMLTYSTKKFTSISELVNYNFMTYFHGHIIILT